ncbi:MAG: hypothetical protein AVDCRST_MAG59-2663, partial [uncultured Thermomicrobiales bacterium]
EGGPASGFRGVASTGTGAAGDHPGLLRPGDRRLDRCGHPVDHQPAAASAGDGREGRGWPVVRDRRRADRRRGRGAERRRPELRRDVGVLRRVRSTDEPVAGIAV